MNGPFTQFRAPGSHATISNLLVIVVGADLRAEIADRSLACRLRDEAARRLGLSAADSNPDAVSMNQLHPVVCTDLWYLNQTALMARPTVSIGDPSVNAASAYLSARLPTAMVVQHSLRIHLDSEFIDRRACLWGADPQATAQAIDVFIERYLDQFLAAAIEV